MIAHEEFRELCALATSGCLTAEEQTRLKAHLASCPECRDTAREYETVARQGIPSLAADFPEDVSQVPFGWSEERAYQDFLRDSDKGSSAPQAVYCPEPCQSSSTIVPLRSTRLWPGQLSRLLPYAAGIVLAVLAGLWGYQRGITRSADFINGAQGHYQEIVSAARAQVARLSSERDLLLAKDQETDSRLITLRAEMASQLSDIKRLQVEEQNLRNSLQASEAEKDKVTTDRDAVLRRLRQLQADLERSQGELASKQKDMEALSQQRPVQSGKEKELEARVAQLEELLKDRDDAIDRQQDLLAHDRDIRDLMGARDLYVAEVVDVGHNGKTKKPFGRIFFTKGKSLIFYAYDLDQQPGLREASSFQAWGRRGPDESKAASLGIFYLDNSSHKRWVVKSDDPNLIQQIDAVFVTVEPKGGSQKPTGKQLLFAYLRVEPNHP